MYMPRHNTSTLRDFPDAAYAPGTYTLQFLGVSYVEHQQKSRTKLRFRVLDVVPEPVSTPVYEVSVRYNADFGTERLALEQYSPEIMKQYPTPGQVIEYVTWSREVPYSKGPEYVLKSETDLNKMAQDNRVIYQYIELFNRQQPDRLFGPFCVSGILALMGLPTPKAPDDAATKLVEQHFGADTKRMKSVVDMGFGLTSKNIPGEGDKSQACVFAAIGSIVVLKIGTAPVNVRHVTGKSEETRRKTYGYRVPKAQWPQRNHEPHMLVAEFRPLPGVRPRNYGELNGIMQIEPLVEWLKGNPILTHYRTLDEIAETYALNVFRWNGDKFAPKLDEEYEPAAQPSAPSFGYRYSPQPQVTDEDIPF